MSFFALSFPMGRFFGIPVRIHFTFILYAIYQVGFAGVYLPLALTFIIGLYASVLLHEFGHSLAARWCDGDVEQIVLWPLGGLAFCRPLFNPKAHLITGAAGPFVSLMLFVGFSLLAHVVTAADNIWVIFIVKFMARANLVLFIFNMIPVFPMDGGRILRDALWLWLGVDRATRVAVIISKTVIILSVILALVAPHFVAQWISPQQLMILAVFIYFQASAEETSLEYEGFVRSFSIRERIHRGIRQRAFKQGMAAKQEQDAAEGFHRCAICGRTEHSGPDLVFRVAADGQEYCQEHLPRREGGRMKAEG